jgi:hypothetical protein
VRKRTQCEGEVAYSIGEIRCEVLRTLARLPFNDRILEVSIMESDALKCGWRGEIIADLTVAEHIAANDALGLLQERLMFASRLETTRCEPESYAAGIRLSTSNDITGVGYLGDHAVL